MLLRKAVTEVRKKERRKQGSDSALEVSNDPGENSSVAVGPLAAPDLRTRIIFWEGGPLKSVTSRTQVERAAHPDSTYPSTPLVAQGLEHAHLSAREALAIQT